MQSGERIAAVERWDAAAASYLRDGAPWSLSKQRYPAKSLAHRE
jgi:hypothetical protein